jgi:hypothetical protein
MPFAKGSCHLEPVPDAMYIRNFDRRVVLKNLAQPGDENIQTTLLVIFVSRNAATLATH